MLVNFILIYLTISCCKTFIRWFLVFHYINIAVVNILIPPKILASGIFGSKTLFISDIIPFWSDA